VELTVRNEVRSQSSTKALVIALLALILIVRLAVWIPQWWGAGISAENDFTLYYLAGWRLRLGASPYEDLLSVKDLAGLPSHISRGTDADLPPVGNPPLLLYLLLHFTLIPYRVAWFVWTAISALTIGLALVLLWRAFLPPLSVTQKAIGLLLILVFPPLAHHIRWRRTESLIVFSQVLPTLSSRSLLFTTSFPFRPSWVGFERQASHYLRWRSTGLRLYLSRLPCLCVTELPTSQPKAMGSW
jgi:hypothetical protein